MFGPSPLELEKAWKEWLSFGPLDTEPTETALFACAFALQRLAVILDKVAIPTWLTKRK